MSRAEFIAARKLLDKTQAQMAHLLGTSVKAVHSYEQGWRSVPVHVERQVYFLLSRKKGSAKRMRPCWDLRECPEGRKFLCPAWEFEAGDLCWFINGTICEGAAHKSWKEKMHHCRRCVVLQSIA